MMLKKIEISNFKAHESLLIELGEASSFLIYGENGSGKSSIYEAIKINYFKERVLDIANLPADPAQRRAKVDEVFNTYNKQDAGSFEIKFNDIEFKKTTDMAADSMNVFMLNLQSCTPTNMVNGTVNLYRLLEREFLSLDIDNVSTDFIQLLVNEELIAFHEVFEIRIDTNGDIRFVDSSRNLDDKRVTKFFNEGKVNLAILLIYFKLLKHSISLNGRNLLVLDDFITSLDMPNRTLLVKYVLREFEGYQVFIFTHNIYFYNLICYLVNENTSASGSWKFFNIYESPSSPILYEQKERVCVNEINRRFELVKINGESVSDSYQSLGNDIRKKFERLLFEFSKLLSIGAVEESKKILGSLLRYDKPILDVGKLLEAVDADDIDISKINALKIDEFSLIKDILLDLKAYQKVMMHPLSHSTGYGEPSYTVKEIESGIKLIKILEHNLKHLLNKKLDGA